MTGRDAMIEIFIYVTKRWRAISMMYTIRMIL